MGMINSWYRFLRCASVESKSGSLKVVRYCGLSRNFDICSCSNCSSF